MSKIFYMSRMITLEIFILSNIIVKTSAMDLEERKLYCLSLRVLFLIKCSITFFLIASKSLVRTLMVKYCDGNEGLPAFLYTGHTLDTFNGVWKHLFLR